MKIHREASYHKYRTSEKGMARQKRYAKQYIREVQSDPVRHAKKLAATRDYQNRHPEKTKRQNWLVYVRRRFGGKLPPPKLLEALELSLQFKRMLPDILGCRPYSRNPKERAKALSLGYTEWGHLRVPKHPITHCPAGHPYNAENTFYQKGRTTKECRTCVKNRNRLRKLRHSLPCGRR